MKQLGAGGCWALSIWRIAVKRPVTSSKAAGDFQGREGARSGACGCLREALCHGQSKYSPLTLPLVLTGGLQGTSEAFGFGHTAPHPEWKIPESQRLRNCAGWRFQVADPAVGITESFRTNSGMLSGGANSSVFTALGCRNRNIRIF